QMQASSLGSKLLAKRSSFNAIMRRLSAVNPEVAGNIADRMTQGERVQPQTQAEKICFGLLKDLDGAAYKVMGSITSKKFMRNEIWSTTAFFNAPTWFITIAWSDLNHPIALYYAQEDWTFRPDLRTYKERNKLMSKNPVAAARFFHFMVQTFLKEILGWEQEDRGIFGHTHAYYATVEQ
ncbi:hypothetical protein B0H14DRAFT_2161678, partial [Mycena olivaceomarginata]